MHPSSQMAHLAQQVQPAWQSRLPERLPDARPQPHRHHGEAYDRGRHEGRDHHERRGFPPVRKQSAQQHLAPLRSKPEPPLALAQAAHLR